MSENKDIQPLVNEEVDTYQPIPTDKVFTEQLRKYKTTDRGHADVFNANEKVLINNDAYLKKQVDTIKSNASTSNTQINTAIDNHKKDTNIHVTLAKQQAWDAKASTAIATSSSNGLMSAADKQAITNLSNTINTTVTGQKVLTEIKKVDGSGSGLDADLLDGKEASAFSLANHTHGAASATTNGFMTAQQVADLNNAKTAINNLGNNYASKNHNHSNATTTTNGFMTAQQVTDLNATKAVVNNLGDNYASKNHRHLLNEVTDATGKNIQQTLSEIESQNELSEKTIKIVSQNIGTSSDTASETSNTLWGRIKYFTNLFSNIWTSARAAKLDNLDAKVSTRATQTSVDTIKTNMDDIKTKVTNINTNVSKVDLSQLMTKINALSTKVEEVKTLALVPKMPKLKIETLKADEGKSYTTKTWRLEGCGRLITLKGTIANTVSAISSSYSIMADDQYYNKFPDGVSGDDVALYGLYNYNGIFMTASRLNMDNTTISNVGLTLNVPFNKSIEIKLTIRENDAIQVIYEIYE